MTFLRTGKPTQPSYKAGYAKIASESAYPELWDGLVGAWVPALGNSGNVHNIVDKTIGTSNSLTWGANYIDFGDAGYIDIGSKPYLTRGKDCSVFWQERVNELDSTYSGRFLLEMSGISKHFGALRTDNTSYNFLSFGPTGSDTVRVREGVPSKASSQHIWNSFLITSSDPSSSNESAYKCFVNGFEKSVIDSGNFISFSINVIGNWVSGQEADCDMSVFCIWDRRLTSSQAKILAADPLAPFRQRRYAPVSLQVEEPSFNNWYARPGRTNRIVGSGVHV